MTVSGQALKATIDRAILTGLLETVPAATFDILLRNVEKTSARILAELADPETHAQQACALAHELRGMLTNFAMVGAGTIAREIEDSGGAFARREDILPRLAQEIEDGLAAISTLARDRQ